MNGVRQAVPATVVLETNTNASMGIGTDAKTSKYGFITYKSNGTKVSEYNGSPDYFILSPEGLYRHFKDMKSKRRRIIITYKTEENK